MVNLTVGARRPNMALHPTIGRSRVNAKALGTSKAKRERVLPSGNISGLENI